MREDQVDKCDAHRREVLEDQADQPVVLNLRNTVHGVGYENIFTKSGTQNGLLFSISLTIDCDFFVAK